MPKPISIGDILKSEADANSRVAVPAAKGTKAGKLVAYPQRNQYLVALTDEINGEVLVQPWNCVVNLDVIAASDIAAIQVGSPAAALTLATLKTQGDAHGIKYIGTPKT